MVKILEKSRLAVEQPVWEYQQGTNLSAKVREISRKKGDGIVWEFVGTDDFVAWNERREWEIDAGRDSEPLLYEPFYQTTTNRAFEKNVTINRLGPAGVFFSQFFEGGETKFATIGASQQAVPIIDWTVGLEYSEQLVEYNQMWDVSIFERQAGIAHNALLNNIHLAPILTYAYTSANQTAASAIGTTLAEKYLHTLEDAVQNAKTDPTNPRRGPYNLLVSANNMFTMERAVAGNSAIGVDMNSSVRAMIKNMVIYDGWTGTMGNKSVAYAGVTPNKAYLIDADPMMKAAYARSYVKFLMMNKTGNPDVSRLIAQQMVLWSALGTYFSAAALVEEISLPTS